MNRFKNKHTKFGKTERDKKKIYKLKEQKIIANVCDKKIEIQTFSVKFRHFQ